MICYGCIGIWHSRFSFLTLFPPSFLPLLLASCAGVVKSYKIAISLLVWWLGHVCCHPCRQYLLFPALYTPASPSYYHCGISSSSQTVSAQLPTPPRLRDRKILSQRRRLQLNATCRHTTLLPYPQQEHMFQDICSLSQIRPLPGLISLIVLYYNCCLPGTLSKEYVPPGRIREEGDNGRCRARREDWSLLYANMQCS